jgi:hypothetical protein
MFLRARVMKFNPLSFNAVLTSLLT